jgi:sugar-specific transcriptional regulator TrmB
MDNISDHEQAVELLQQLGLKEYESKAFVALSRLPSGTAKDISDISEVPRTRVYDAIRVLETKGLVEIQHSNPQQFRAVPVAEAVETLRDEYEHRTASLREALNDIETVTPDDESEVTHEVWGLSGESAIRNRTTKLVDEADSELVLVVGDESVLTTDLVDRLRHAERRNVSIIIGAVTADLREQIQRDLPNIEVFVSELDWLQESALAEDHTQITRLLLLDNKTILVSTLSGQAGGDAHEQAIFGRGFDNGLVTIARRLMSTGLEPTEDPGSTDA